MPNHINQPSTLDKIEAISILFLMMYVVHRVISHLLLYFEFFKIIDTVGVHCNDLESKDHQQICRVFYNFVMQSLIETEPYSFLVTIGLSFFSGVFFSSQSETIKSLVSNNNDRPSRLDQAKAAVTIACSGYALCNMLQLNQYMGIVSKLFFHCCRHMLAEETLAPCYDMRRDLIAPKIELMIETLFLGGCCAIFLFQQLGTIHFMAQEMSDRIMAFKP